jgi:hypothetical protein
MVRPSESPPVVREILNLLPNDLWFLLPTNRGIRAGKASTPAAARPDAAYAAGGASSAGFYEQLLDLG